jgi:hypothetical protein
MFTLKLEEESQIALFLAPCNPKVIPEKFTTTPKKEVVL